MSNLISLQEEFLCLYDFLTSEVPKYFVESVGLGDFSVNPSVDDEPVASFLFNYDQFTDLLPLEIQRYLKNLNIEWLIIASFNIKNPISDEGIITRSPCFKVTRNSITGFVNITELKRIWGSRLVAAQSED